MGTHQFPFFVLRPFTYLRLFMYFAIYTSTSLVRLTYFYRFSKEVEVKSLYFGSLTSNFCQIWISYWSRSTGRRKVGGSKYRKGRYENGRSIEKVELMRTQRFCCILYKFFLYSPWPLRVHFSPIFLRFVFRKIRLKTKFVRLLEIWRFVFFAIFFVTIREKVK